MTSVSPQMPTNLPQSIDFNAMPTPSSTSITLDHFKVQLAKIENFAIVPEAIESLDTLFVYLNNLINSPTELKYHTISAVNIHFHERLGHLAFSEALLASIGYNKLTQPIPHYRFNIDLLADQKTTATTLVTLQEALRLVEGLRNQLNAKYKELPHIPPTSVPLSSVVAAGRFADRGRRVTMEDQEALIDQFYPQMAEDLARLYAEYLLIHQTTANSPHSQPFMTSRDALTQELLQLMPNYSNLAFFAVYDGHGGTETAEFVVKFLHQSIRQEILQFISQKLHLEPSSQPQIKQQQQFLHITDQFLTQLPTIDQIQERPTDCIESTDFSGKKAFQYYEDFISQYLTTALSATPSSPIVPESPPNGNGFEHPLIAIKTPTTTALLSEKASEFGGIVSKYASPTSSPAKSPSSSSSLLSNEAQPLTPSTIATSFAELAPTRILTRALFQAHVRTDNQLRRCLALHSGCTTVASIVGNFGGQRFIITGNCGDSRAIMTSQSTQCCHFAGTARHAKPHIFLRHLDTATQTILHSTQFSTHQSATTDQYFAKLPVQFDTVKGLPTHQLQHGDTTISPSHRVLAQRLSLDHKPSIPNETSRIASLGGFVSNNGRTMGVLAVSRALGDHGLKNTRHYVSSRPHIDLTLLADPDDNNAVLNPFLLLACDGVWDVIQDQDAVLFISGVVSAAVQHWLKVNNVQICATPSASTNASTTDSSSTVHDDVQNNITTYQFNEQFASGAQGSGNADDKTHKNALCATCAQRYLPKTMLNSAMALASQRLVELALLNGSTDNVTAMTIRL